MYFLMKIKPYFNMTIREKILENDLLYFKNFNQDEDMTLKEFVFNVITNYTVNLPSYSAKTGIAQCARNRHRSFGDIFNIVRFYYPEATCKKVKESLLELQQEGTVYIQLCNMIKKFIYYLPNQQGHSRNLRPSQMQTRDEYGMRLQDTNFTIKFNPLLSLQNI